MTETVTIAGRFRGPPVSGNGGYSCGTVAGFIDGPAHVRLRAPIPLDQPLAIERRPDGSVAMVHPTLKGRDGAPFVLAEARPDEPEVDVPAPPSWAEAEAAMQRFLGFERHPFPTCFVCGPRREAGDAMRIFPGPVEGRELVASTWIPDASLAGPDGAVAPVYLWAALDCPGGFAAVLTEQNVLVLGELAARIFSRPRPGERCVAMGWPRGRDARKHFVGSAVASESGEIYACAVGTWIQIRGASA